MSEEIKAALDGLFAFDTGSTDSGISDPLLRGGVREHLSALNEQG